jgi:hypothetical protein
MGRRALIVVVAVLGAIPVVTGLMEVFLGPSFAPGGEAVNPSLDSEWRYAHTFWLAAGVLLWWSLFAPEKRAPVTRVILIIAALGGLARLVSVLWVGWPHPVFIASLVLEVVILPFVIWWHWRVFPSRDTVKPGESGRSGPP